MNDWTAPSAHEARVQHGYLACGKRGRWYVRLASGAAIWLADWRIPAGAGLGDHVAVTTSRDGEDVFSVRKSGG